jgi:hypothetical protein
MVPAASRFAMWLSAGSGVFLAFGWPFLPGADPSSETFHALAVGTLVVLLGSIAATLVAKR